MIFAILSFAILLQFAKSIRLVRMTPMKASLVAAVAVCLSYNFPFGSVNPSVRWAQRCVTLIPESCGKSIRSILHFAMPRRIGSQCVASFVSNRKALDWSSVYDNATTPRISYTQKPSPALNIVLSVGSI